MPMSEEIHRPMSNSDDKTPLAFVLLNEIGIINQLSSARFEAALPNGLNQPQFSVLNNFARLGGTPHACAACRCISGDPRGDDQHA